MNNIYVPYVLSMMNVWTFHLLLYPLFIVPCGRISPEITVIVFRL